MKKGGSMKAHKSGAGMKGRDGFRENRQKSSHSKPKSYGGGNKNSTYVRPQSK